MEWKSRGAETPGLRGEIAMKWDKRLLGIFVLTGILFMVPVYPVHAKDAIIEKLVVLPSSDYNVKEAEAMKERLAKIPAHILNKLHDKGVKIKLTNDIITNEPELSYLKGVTPRGWEGTGKTWDDVPGVSEHVVVARIGYSKQGQGHNSFNLELHETMHAVDCIVFNEISSTKEFKNIFNQEANINYYEDGYVLAYPVEYFTETASLYVYSDATREELKKTTPLTYEFMDKLFTNPS
ncbi:hypothetical protein PPOP_1359 [Paenibacillus popilliae ATCC 14706]|uniref:ATLF-like domain-containing protein n=2 Tax=Paenibacillus popilliae TaxID=78057 RepID=M9L9D1_PAEPP|nr:hypothetical protein PPOP_1359 [Paenibacillus popilliae ATCC 14706]